MATDIIATVPTQNLNVFVVNKPRDVVYGFGGGLANLGIGIGGAAAMVVAAPIYCTYIGASANGFMGGLAGFGIGLGIGIVGSCALLVGGVYTCLTQVPLLSTYRSRCMHELTPYFPSHPSFFL